MINPLSFKQVPVLIAVAATGFTLYCLFATPHLPQSAVSSPSSSPANPTKEPALSSRANLNPSCDGLQFADTDISQEVKTADMSTPAESGFTDYPLALENFVSVTSLDSPLESGTDYSIPVSSTSNSTGNWSSPTVSSSTSSGSGGGTKTISSGGGGGGGGGGGSSTGGDIQDSETDASSPNLSETTADISPENEVPLQDENTPLAGGGSLRPDAEEESRPIVIWYFHVQDDPLESLELALSSGIPTHVNLYVSNRWTGRILTKPKYQKKLKEAIDIARQYQAKTILARNLWPTYEMDSFDSSIVYSPDYYTQEIELLREEGQTYNTDYVGLDVEPYGDSPVKKYFDWYENYQPTEHEAEMLQNSIGHVLAETGTIDFIYPAGSLRDYNYYNTISLLGEMRIAESTYYDNEVYQLVAYPYQIFGVYVNTQITEQEKGPYYLVESVFENSARWETKEGIFFYRREGKAYEIADALYQYSQISSNE